MSTYPYPGNESYPFDDEHMAYLSQYNTRVYEYQEPDRQYATHDTIYTDYVKVDVSTGDAMTTSTVEMPTTSAVSVSTSGVVFVSTTVAVTVTVTAMVAVEVDRPVIPLPYMSLIGFLAIMWSLIAIRRIRRA
jgi:hypothetical protein